LGISLLGPLADRFHAYASQKKPWSNATEIYTPTKSSQSTEVNLRRLT